ncbi:MAG: phage tail assembly chaperone [Pseudomonadota bacterium]
MSGGDDAFDWDLLMRFGLGVLGLAPRDFWKMTPREFDAAMQGRLGRLKEAEPMGVADFAALAARFPDERAGT